MVAFGILEMGVRRVVICRNVDFPEDYIRTVVKNNDQFVSPLFDRWVRSQTPQVLHAGNLTGDESSVWTEAFLGTGVYNLIGHGVADLTRSRASFFSFGGNRGGFTLCHQDILRVVVPHLHTTLVRLYSPTD